MKLKLWVDKEFCKVAIAHELSNGNNVKSLKSFKVNIEDYMSLFGRMCIDDHEGECNDYMEEAEKIVDKYYKY